MPNSAISFHKGNSASCCHLNTSDICALGLWQSKDNSFTLLLSTKPLYYDVVTVVKLILIFSSTT